MTFQGWVSSFPSFLTFSTDPLALWWLVTLTHLFCSLVPPWSSWQWPIDVSHVSLHQHVSLSSTALSHPYPFFHLGLASLISKWSNSLTRGGDTDAHERVLPRRGSVSTKPCHGMTLSLEQMTAFILGLELPAINRVFDGSTSLRARVVILTFSLVTMLLFWGGRGGGEGQHLIGIIWKIINF